MFLVDSLLLVAGVLVILGILSSKFSARAGLPVLVMFLLVGMLAGSDGPGGIPFENYELAHAIGTVSLALILFDGGLQSPLSSLTLAWRPAVLLATIGVLVTSLITGVVAATVLGLSWLEGLLLGAIVGSTDAAAVFSLLRSAGVHLQRRLGATLELESGANDPMAIFLTVGLIQVITGEMPLGFGLAKLFALQMGVGLGVGLAAGWLTVKLVNRINLAAAGLYPVLTASCGLAAFGLAATLHGSGFLAIYVAGLVVGNSKLVFRRGTLLFHDGIAWTSQIVMFVVLGLLSTPSALLDVALPGLIIALVLMLVARPLAVVPLLVPFGFSRAELGLVSWVGLKGAVPIILATYPLHFGLPAGPLLFNIVFFVVLLSAVVQGGTLAWMARWLGLEEPPPPASPLSLEISSLRDVDAEIVDFQIADASPLAGRKLRDLALPEDAVVALITRGKQVLPARGDTSIEAGDHLFLVVNESSRQAMDAVFGRTVGAPPCALGVEIALRATTRLDDLAVIYGLTTSEPPTETLEALLHDRLLAVQPGATLEVGALRLRVLAVEGGRARSVGVTSLLATRP